MALKGLVLHLKKAIKTGQKELESSENCKITDPD